MAQRAEIVEIMKEKKRRKAVKINRAVKAEKVAQRAERVKAVVDIVNVTAAKPLQNVNVAHKESLSIDGYKDEILARIKRDRVTVIQG